MCPHVLPEEWRLPSHQTATSFLFKPLIAHSRRPYLVVACGYAKPRCFRRGQTRRQWHQLTSTPCFPNPSLQRTPTPAYLRGCLCIPGDMLNK